MTKSKFTKKEKKVFYLGISIGLGGGIIGNIFVTSIIE
jgi:hypothetical protein